MTRFLTSLVLLAATLAPAQAGLFDWANSGSATNLAGTGFPSAYFQVTQKDANSTLDRGDCVTAIFDFGTINSRRVFGFMQAEIDASPDGNGVIFTNGDGAESLEGVLGLNGFTSQLNALTDVGTFATPTFALLSNSDTSKTLANTNDQSSGTLGLTTSDGWEIDLLAGLNGSQDTLRWYGTGVSTPISETGTESADTGTDFVLGLTVTDYNGADMAWDSTSYTYGSTTASTDLVVQTSGGLDSVLYSNATGYNFKMEGPDLTFTAVPEPSSLAVLALVGVAGSAMRRRRK